MRWGPILLHGEHHDDRDGDEEKTDDEEGLHRAHRVQAVPRLDELGDAAQQGVEGRAGGLAEKLEAERCVLPRFAHLLGDERLLDEPLKPTSPVPAKIAAMRNDR